MGRDRLDPGAWLEPNPCGYAILGTMKTASARHLDLLSADPHKSWGTVRAHLEAVRKPIYDEIAAYPMPITGCDAQYNYLLEKRDAILREIGRMEAAVKTQPDADAAAVFMATSTYFNGGASD